jgi:hypothetical protein
VAAPRNELGPRSFGWWLETFERRHAASGVLRVRGDAAVRAGAFEDAEAFYLLAKSAAPKAQDHARSGRDQERMAGLEASAALARLYHRGKQSVDPDGRKLDALTNAIFDDKMEAYAQQNVPGMRQFHETLSVIYYDSKRWDKADFQLARTVETEKTLARMKGRDPAPLPHIERMRTDTLVHLGRYDDAAKSAVTASRGFFALKQPEQVPDTLRLVAPKLDQLSEPRRAEYRLWQQVSEGTRGFFEQDSERQVRTVREIESKLTPTGAGNVTIDRKVLGEALDGLLERAGDRARAAGKTTEQKQLSQERTRLRAEFPDLRKP